MHNKKQQIIDMPLEKNYTIVNKNDHRKRYDMRVLNIGSMNIDFVYSVDHIILPGETEATGGMNVFLGGKGINQSMALAKAGVEV